MTKDTAIIFDKICGLSDSELDLLLEKLKHVVIHRAYRQWIAEIDEVMGTLIKHSSKDLPDFPYKQYFDLGTLPGETAHMACQTIIQKEQAILEQVTF